MTHKKPLKLTFKDLTKKSIKGDINEVRLTIYKIEKDL